LFVLTLVGAFVLGRRHQCWWCVALLMIVAGYLIISPAGAGQARFRVPAAPSLAFLSGAGLAGLLSSLSRRA
jgi:drug/metabolite transporter (DMT)-like permease